MSNQISTNDGAHGDGAVRSMKCSASFPELSDVNKKTWRFWRKYLSHCLRYPLFFFREAPVRKWLDFFGSTHRVAWDCARASCALENQPDVWNKGALRGRFLRWGEDKLKTLNSEIRRPGPDAPEQNQRRQPGSPASNG